MNCPAKRHNAILNYSLLQTESCISKFYIIVVLLSVQTIAVLLDFSLLSKNSKFSSHSTGLSFSQ
jgi:hypothetical protein